MICGLSHTRLRPQSVASQAKTATLKGCLIRGCQPQSAASIHGNVCHSAARYAGERKLPHRAQTYIPAAFLNLFVYTGNTGRPASCLSSTRHIITQVGEVIFFSILSVRLPYSTHRQSQIGYPVLETAWKHRGSVPVHQETPLSTIHVQS